MMSRLLAVAVAACIWLSTLQLVYADSLVVQVDAPTNDAILRPYFLITGFALDPYQASNVDAVHVWAYPGGLGSGRPTMWVGAPTLGQNRDDAAAMFGGAFTGSGFALVASLPADTYALVIYARRASNAEWQSTVVSVTVTACQWSQQCEWRWNGSSWALHCAWRCT